jgi:outer membrane protein assembly factor BamB
MSSLNSCQLLFVSVLMVSCALPLVHAAEGGKVFTIANDEFGPVYRVDMNKVKSAADLAAVPGVKIAWDLQGHRLSGWLANADDWDDDGQIDLVFAAETNDRRCIIRYTHEGKERWRSEQINQGMGHESGMAVQDLDGDGKQEIIFNVLRQLWCIDFDTGKTKWKIDLPACRDNYQASVAGHFLSRNRLAVVCRVERNVTCYDAMGKMAWTCQIDNRNYYGHDMASYDADGDGLDEVYISLNGKFLCLGGDGKFRWSDPNCSNHSDFVLFGDVDGDGDTDVVYDRDGCNAMGGPIVCMDGKTARQIHQWTYARPGKDHIQRATLGDFDPSRSGLELAGVGKEPGLGGLMMWSDEGGPAWRKDIPAQWVTCGDWNGDGKPEIMTTCKNGWEVWAGTGKRQYAIKGVGELPLDVESAGRPRPDLDGNGRADVLLSSGRGYILLMEAP